MNKLMFKLCLISLLIMPFLASANSAMDEDFYSIDLIPIGGVQDEFDRLFDEFSDQLEIYKDHDLVSAWMLGHDTALISSPKNARDVIDILSDSNSKLLMTQHMSESQAGKINPIDFCLDSIETFQNGFRAQQTVLIVRIDATLAFSWCF